MPLLSFENRYSNRLNRVLNYAHANGHRTLRLEHLADRANLSKFRFARVFHDCVGESPVRFLRRIRLEKAASLLKHEGQYSVSDVASRCGFSTPQLFSRVFGDRFGVSPNQFRIDHFDRMEDRSSTGYVNAIRNNFNDICAATNASITDDQIDVVNLLPTTVAYVRSIGSYGGCRNIGDAMVSIRKWAEQHELWTANSKIIGISWDYSSITPAGLCRYDAGVTVPSVFRSCRDVSMQTIPGGIYATAKFPYRRPSDLPKIWWWFSLTIKSSERFRKFKPALSVGPWCEVYRSSKEDDYPMIELFTRLKPSRARQRSLRKR